MKWMQRIIGLTAWMFAVGSQAAVIAYDDFPMDGNLSGSLGGAGFSDNWSGGSYSISGGVVSGTGQSYRTLSMPFGTTGEVWISFNFGVPVEQDSYGGLSLFDGTTERLIVGDCNQVDCWGVEGKDGPQEIKVNSTTLGFKKGAVRIRLGAGATSTVDFWIGPDADTPVNVFGPPDATVSGQTLAGVDRVCIGAGLVMNFGDLVVGEAWQDIDAVYNAGDGTSWLVSYGESGLEYTPYANEGQTNEVNTVPDFSSAGYKGGGVPIPFVPAAVKVYPGEGDDSERIQDAIDAVSARPMGADGFRGAVLITAGDYSVSNTLTISASGVVIRGLGSQSVGGTRITYTATSQSNLFKIDNDGGSPVEVGGSRVNITDAYVPVGAQRFNVTDASGFSVGDTVFVQNLMNQKWIEDISDMSQWGWTNTAYQLKFRRTVTAVNGNEITLDAPLVQAIEDQYGGGVLYRYTFANELENIGIEGLRLESTYTADDDEEHGWRAIEVHDLKNGWIRQVTGLYFGFGLVSIESVCRNITVEDCAMFDPKSQTTGGRKYSFNIDDSTYILMQRCLTRGGRHDFVSGSLAPGPNVFVDCRANDTLEDIGPHQRYSTGQLYDSIMGGQMNVQNRKWSGSGHGWAGAQIMFWNCDASSIMCDAPTGAMSWCVGSMGTMTDPARAQEEPFGIWDSHRSPVQPRSLYYAQLEDLLGTDALRNVMLPQQVVGSIWDDLDEWSGEGLFLDGLVVWQESEITEPGESVSIRGALRNLQMLDQGYTSVWQKVSGPGTVSFTDASALETTATFTDSGTYELQLIADMVSSSDTLSDLVSEDYEDGTIGAVPPGVQDLTPSAPEDDHAIVIVGEGSNLAGTGNALRLYDDNSSRSTRVAYDASLLLSVARADFSFAPLSTSASGDRFIISFGEYGVNQTSSAYRFLDCGMNADGTMDFRSGTGPDSEGHVLLASNNTLSIFVNDYDSESVTYTGLDDNEYILQTNSVAYWLNGSLVLETLMENRTTANGTIFNSENNIGRFSIMSYTSDWGLDYVIDDLQVSTGFHLSSPTDYELDDFESYALGAIPTQANDISPSTPAVDYAAVVVGGSTNVAGTGNALRLLDDSSTSVARVGYDLVGSAAAQFSAAQINFSFAALNTAATGDRFSLSFGEYGVNQSSGTKRFLDCRLNADGTVDFISGPGADSSGHVLLPSMNSLQIFANDYDAQVITYTGPDENEYQLQTNSVAYWLNGSLVLETLMENRTTANGTTFTSEGNIGRFSIASFTGALGLDYVFDDFRFSEIGVDSTETRETAILQIVVPDHDGADTLYQEWVALYPTLGTATNMMDDFEPDGLDNLAEYALGGDPTVNDTASILPVSQLMEDTGTNWLYYVYRRREDAAERGLTYTLYSGGDLVDGSVTNIVLPIGISDAVDGFESVTNRIPTDIESRQFMGLKIDLD